MVLLRELAVLLRGGEQLVLLALAAWLLASGLGAAAGRLRAEGSPLLTRLLLLLWALLLPASVVLARALPRMLGAQQGDAQPLELQLGALALLVLPGALLAGALFRFSARCWLRPGRSLAQAYGLESLGALLGGAASTGLLALGLGNLVAAVAVSLLAVIAAAWPGPGQRGWLRAITLPATVLLVLLLAVSGPLDRALTSLEHPDLIDSRDTPYGRVTIDARGEQVVLFLNGALAFETQGLAQDAFVHSAALQVQAPQRVLLLGGGAQGLLPPLLQHRPERVDLVEPDPVSLALLGEHLPAAQRDALDDPAVRLHTSDPRAYLQRPERYDLILMAQPEPATAAANRTWTLEAFALCAQRLKPGGVLAFSLPGSENLWSPTLTLRNAGLHAALRANFADVLVLPGTENIWLASGAELSRQPRFLAHRLAERAIQSDLVHDGWLSYQLENDRTAEIAALLEAHPAPANRDDRPSAASATLILWAGRFVPRLALQDPTPLLERSRRLAPPALGGVGLLMAGLAVALRRRPGPRRLALAWLAGMLGALLEAVLLLRFQVQHGVLFGQLGLLLGAFMAGLAAGALGLDLLQRRLMGPPRWLGAGVGVAGLLVAAVVLGSCFQPTSLVQSAALLLASGAVTAAAFARAARLGDPDGGRVAGLLYGADLLGGCLGFLLASLALVPLLGLGITGGVGLGLALVGTLLLQPAG